MDRKKLSPMPSYQDFYQFAKQNFMLYLITISKKKLVEETNEEVYKKLRFKNLNGLNAFQDPKKDMD